MSKAQIKLSEAAYFLTGMRDEVDHQEAFVHELSAFLSAARSVTDYLREEFALSSGFADWKESTWRRLMEDPVIAFLFEERRKSVHVERRAPDAHVQVEEHEVIHFTDAVIVQVIREGEVVETRRIEDPPPQPPPEPGPTRITWRWYFSDLQNVDVVTGCAHLLLVLRGVVEECERAFG